MKKFRLVPWLVYGASAMTLACAHPHRAVVVVREPPADVVETAPTSPGPQYVWVKGHYKWTGSDYEWVSGHWAIPPQGYSAWVPGHWTQQKDGNWVWIEGHWK